MIVGAGVCPGAPFLIDGLADAIAAELAVVGVAGREVVALFPDCDTVLLVAAAPASSRITDTPDRVIAPGSLISSAALGRSDRPTNDAPLSGRPDAAHPVVADAVVGTMVGAHLLAGAVSAEVTAVEINGDPAVTAGMLAGYATSGDRVVLLAIADGSACHGDHAPGRRDDRSIAFDAALADALAVGDPAQLAAACADRVLARDLLATVDALAVLAALTSADPPDTAELLYRDAPLGAGYLVASWRWAGS